MQTLVILQMSLATSHFGQKKTYMTRLFYYQQSNKRKCLMWLDLPLWSDYFSDHACKALIIPKIPHITEEKNIKEHMTLLKNLREWFACISIQQQPWGLERWTGTWTRRNQ